MDVKKMYQLAEAQVSGRAYGMIARRTARNDHTGAMIVGATVLGTTHLKKKLELLQQLQALEGSMPRALAGYRDLLYKDLMAVAKQQLSEKDYEAFHMAF